MKTIAATLALSLIAASAYSRPLPASELSAVFKSLVEASSLSSESPEARLKLVRAVESYCREIQRAFPTNSPSEDAWIESERAGSTDRLARLIQSPEWARMRTSQFTSGCLHYSRIYIKGSKEERILGLAGISAEMIRWSPNAKYFAELNNIDAKMYGLDIVGLMMPTKFADAVVSEVAQQ